MRHGNIANSLLLIDSAAGAALPNIITYNFYSNLPTFYYGPGWTLPWPDADGTLIRYDASGLFSPFTPAEQALANAAMGVIERQIGVDFQLGSTNSLIGFGALNIAGPTDGSDATLAFTNSRGLDGFPASEDVWLYSGGRTFHPDYTILHEVLHSMGLTDARDVELPGDEDSNMYTVLSYKDHAVTPGVYGTELQLYDVAALQYLYGAATNNGGDTVHDDFSVGNLNRYYAISDSGQTDTISATSGTGAALIDLRPGYFSSLGKQDSVTHDGTGVTGEGTQNISIAFGTVIENAIGGDDGDVIIGNAVSNILFGGAGDDLIYAEGFGLDGEDGDYSVISIGQVTAHTEDPSLQRDILLGGDGNDDLYDGRGSDVLAGQDDDDRIHLTEDLAVDYVLGGSGDEQINGSSGVDIIFGDELSQAQRPHGLQGRAADFLGRFDAARTAIEEALPADYDEGSSGGNDAVDGQAGDDIISGGGGDDTLDGGEGDDLVLGDAGMDILAGGDGNDLLFGGSGDDTLDGEAGDDFLHGGTGSDDVRYLGDVFSLNYTATDAGFDGLTIGSEGTDQLVSIEKVYLLASNVQVKVERDMFARGIDIEIRAKNGGRDSLDLSSISNDLRFNAGRVGSGLSVGSVIDAVTGGGVRFFGFDDLRFGSGDDRVSHDVVNSVIDLGDGDDVLLHAAVGTEIYGGFGADIFVFSPNTRVMDASGEDRIHYGGLALTGGFRTPESSSPYAFGLNPFVGYAINREGDLVIRDFIGGLISGRRAEMFVANYHSAVDGGVATAGIHVFELSIGAYRLLDSNRPKATPADELFKIFLGDMMKALYGFSSWAGVDPLVLDLDGDGFDLAASGASMFDYDGDGYLERGGWARGDDGFLVLDADGDGQVRDVGELFGGPTMSGFAELATHDLNLDGVIDAADAVYSELQIWRDLNQNREVDAGELSSLLDLGIAAISLSATPGSQRLVGNVVTATSNFIRTDGSTGLIGDVAFSVDQQNSVWSGDRTVSAAAAALPTLKGYGTVLDLGVAMTLQPALQTTLSATLTEMTTLNLLEWRAIVLPLLADWAAASPIPSSTAVGGHDDLIIRNALIDGVWTAVDFAYQVVDAETGETSWYWASSDALAGDVEALVVDQPPAGAASYISSLDGRYVDFFERYFGETIPIGGRPDDGEGVADAIDAFLTGLWRTVDQLSVRLAMQGPLSDYFDGLEYDVANNTIVATTDRQLVPLFEAVFAEAALMGTAGLAYVEAWSGILDFVIGDYVQPDGLLNTHGFVFSNIVAAYESTGLQLDIRQIAASLRVPDDLLWLGEGRIVGSDDADIFYLAEGDQVAVGGLGPDTYVVGKDFGRDVIDDFEDVLQEHSEDIIRFADIRPDEVTARREGIDLVISVNGTDDELRIANHFDGRLPALGGGGDLSPSTGIDMIAFADGTVWGAVEIAHAVSRSTAAGDTITGTETTDWLDGIEGDDFLSGGSDADVYVYGRGYGHDTVSDLNQHIYLGGPDILVFTDGVTFGDLRFSRAGNSLDLVVSVIGEEGSLTIVDQFHATYTGVLGVYWMDQIESFRFEDGTSFDWKDVALTLLGQARTAGNDQIHGFALEDVLDGGGGDDFLSGGNENDTYLFARGYGHDTIHERWDNILSGGEDRIVFSAGITPGDLNFSRDNNDLVITISDTGDSIRIKDQYVVTETGVFGAIAFDQIETFEFSDGTVLNWADLRLAVFEASQTPGDDVVIGTHFADVFDAGTGDDRLEGGNGGDTYRFGLGDGADVIRDYTANLFTNDPDTLAFGEGINPGDIVLSRYGSDGNSVRLSVAGTSDSVSIENQFNYTTIAFKEYEVERFSFADGTVWTANDLRLHVLAQSQSAGNDVVDGFWTDDVIEGGTGDDLLRGGDGSDTYRFESGFGQDEIRETVLNVAYGDFDTVAFGADLVSADAIFSRQGNDLMIGFTGRSETLLIHNQFLAHASYAGWSDIERFSFGEGVILTDADVRVLLTAASATAGDDVITGFSTADVIDGGAGDDELRGLGGSDTYIFGTLSGQDTIIESIGTVYEDLPDTIAFTNDLTHEDVVFTRHGDDLLVTLKGSPDSVRVQGHFGPTGYASVERFAFADGLVLDKAAVAIIVLQTQSTPGDDLILGTIGADFIVGGAGNDTLRGQDGSDVYRFDVGFGIDVIQESVGNVSIVDLDVIEFGPGLSPADAIVSRSGLDLVIAFPTGDRVTVPNQFGHEAYFDGWNDIESVRFADGTIWTVADLRDRILTQASTSGADVITGFWGADLIDGGAGDDILAGLGGNDTYTFSFGSGHDRIDETHGAYEGVEDTVLFGPEVTPEDVAVSRTGTDLVLTLAGGADSLTVRNFFIGERHEVERFVFASGLVLSATEVTALAVASQATAGDDSILGSRLNDFLSGGTGNDTLSGGAGNDIYAFNNGDGRDVVQDGSGGIDEIRLANAWTPANVSLYRSGDSLVIETSESADAILIRHHFSGPGAIEVLRFSDGTVWGAAEILAKLDADSPSLVMGTFLSESISGTNADETVRGRQGDDTLSGGGGSDVYVYARGDGSDTVSDLSFSSVNEDSLHLLDIDSSEVSLAQSGQDLLLVIGGATITVVDHFFQTGAGRGLESIIFADAVTWDRTDIALRALIRGTDGDDTLSTGDGDSRLFGGLGNDTLSGGWGSDTYLYRSGDGNDQVTEGNVAGIDRLELADLNPDDVILTRTGSNLFVNILLTGQSIRFDQQFSAGTNVSGYGIENLAFADGSVWSRDDIALNVFVQGTNGNDTLTGGSSNDRLFGGLGDDTLAGGAGADIYLYRSGDGNDVITESSTVGADVMRFADLDASDLEFSRSGSTLIIRDMTTGQTVTWQSQFSTGTTSNGYGVESIVFADASVWNRADIQTNAWIRGTAGNDTLTGSSASDTLLGGAGNDSVSGGSGGDTYVYRSGDGSDVISESATGVDTLYLKDMVADDVILARSGNHLLVRVLATGDVIRFESHFLTGPTSEGYGVERIRFADNQIWDRATLQANAWIRGTTGVDSLSGSGDPDIVFGDLGGDTLAGGSGGDTYVYRSGDGSDVISENSSGIDTLHLVDMTSEDIALARSGNHLLITILATGEVIRSEYHFLTGPTAQGYGIERIKFADNAIWDRQTMQNEADGVGARSASTEPTDLTLIAPGKAEWAFFQVDSDAFVADWAQTIAPAAQRGSAMAARPYLAMDGAGVEMLGDPHGTSRHALGDGAWRGRLHFEDQLEFVATAPASTADWFAQHFDLDALPGADPAAVFRSAPWHATPQPLLASEPGYAWTDLQTRSIDSWAI